MPYLCGRPLHNRGRCVLGRETAIQKMVWGKDGWLRTLDGQVRHGIAMETFQDQVIKNIQQRSLTLDFAW